MSWLFSFKIDIRGGPGYVMHLKKNNGIKKKKIIMALSIFAAFIVAKCLSSNVLTVALMRISPDC